MGAKLHDSHTELHNVNSPQTVLWFHCPGCQNAHGFHVPQWTWNGSMEVPTFMPSLMCNGHDPASRCHSFVKDGKIQFLADCWHSLAGQTVDLPDWDSETTFDELLTEATALRGKPADVVRWARHLASDIANLTD